MSKSVLSALDISQQRCFTFSKDELERFRDSEASKKDSPQKHRSHYVEPKKFEKRVSQQHTEEDDIQKVVEETKEREERIRKQLEILKEQAQLAVAECNEEGEVESDEEKKEIRNQLTKYESQLTSVKDTMENILHFTKQTHNEVQKTKDLVSSIHELTPNKYCASFQSNLVEDEESANEGAGTKYSVIEKPGAAFQQSPLLAEDDGLSKTRIE